MADDQTPVRRAVSRLERPGGQAAPELADYATAIKAMRQLASDDPRSLVYQAAIHGKSGQRTSDHPDWDRCQHQSWFFLPWHRMYLREFEKIVCALLGKPSWRLPYWDYTADSSLSESDRWSVPREFLDPPNQRLNPLFVNGRARTSLKKEEREWESAMASPLFATSSGTTLGSGFGGGAVESPEQFATAPTGLLEGQPHNTVHRIVGGMMGSPFLAGLDPLFWLHHATIDRLWEVWLQQSGRTNPTVTPWLDTEFTFPTAAGEPVTMKVSAVLDIRSMGYAYDDTTPPTAPPRTELRAVGLERAVPALSTEEALGAEVIGATDRHVRLDPGATFAVGLERPAAWGLTRGLRRSLAPEEGMELETLATEAAMEGQVFLQLENVRGMEPAVGVFAIYINVPAGEDPADHPELRAGLFSTFGLEGASAQGHGMTQAFNITDVARRLYQEGRWDATNVSVTLAAQAAVDEREPSVNDVTVDRIAVYVEPPR